MNKWSTPVVGAVVGALVVAACGSDGTETTADGGGSDAAIVVDGAWARTSPAMADAGAVYMTITAGSDDVLLGLSVDATIAAEAQVHETVMVEPADGEDHSDMGDVMQMRELDGLPLPAGEAVALVPGGYHIMLLSLPTPLATGQTFDITLDFETAPDQLITVEVMDEAPTS